MPSIEKEPPKIDVKAIVCLPGGVDLVTREVMAGNLNPKSPLPHPQVTISFPPDQK